MAAGGCRALGDQAFIMTVSNRSDAVAIISVPELGSETEIKPGETGIALSAGSWVGYRGNVVIMNEACATIAEVAIPSDHSRLVIGSDIAIASTFDDVSRLPRLAATDHCHAKEPGRS